MAQLSKLRYYAGLLFVLWSTSCKHDVPPAPLPSSKPKAAPNPPALIDEQSTHITIPRLPTVAWENLLFPVAEGLSEVKVLSANNINLLSFEPCFRFRPKLIPRKTIPGQMPEQEVPFHAFVRINKDGFVLDSWAKLTMHAVCQPLSLDGTWPHDLWIKKGPCGRTRAQDIELFRFQSGKFRQMDFDSKTDHDKWIKTQKPDTPTKLKIPPFQPSELLVVGDDFLLPFEINERYGHIENQNQFMPHFRVLDRKGNYLSSTWKGKKFPNFLPYAPNNDFSIDRFFVALESGTLFVIEDSADYEKESYDQQYSIRVVYSEQDGRVGTKTLHLSQKEIPTISWRVSKQSLLIAVHDRPTEFYLYQSTSRTWKKIQLPSGRQMIDARFVDNDKILVLTARIGETFAELWEYIGYFKRIVQFPNASAEDFNPLSNKEPSLFGSYPNDLWVHPNYGFPLFHFDKTNQQWLEVLPPKHDAKSDFQSHKAWTSKDNLVWFQASFVKDGKQRDVLYRTKSTKNVFRCESLKSFDLPYWHSDNLLEYSDAQIGTQVVLRKDRKSSK
jgi:hypothetical protein